MSAHTESNLPRASDSGKPERLVVAILLVLSPLACLRHVFRQFSDLWDLAILNIIINICVQNIFSFILAGIACRGSTCYMSCRRCILPVHC